MRISEKMYKIMFLNLIMVFFFVPFSWAEESQVLEPVQIFIIHYGSDMGKVAEVVTDEFREGRSKDEWATRTGKMLKSYGYNRLTSEIRQTVKHEDLAYVHVRAKIDTMVGHVEHDELYRVVRDGDTWKIDALEVVNEDIEARLEML
jgi:hypothetical protein